MQHCGIINQHKDLRCKQRDISMAFMAKRKPTRKSEPAEEAKKDPSVYPLRIRDETLWEAIARFAAQHRWSKNQAITVLLERALVAEQLWAPPGTPETPA
jgi:hypothetical protein